MGESKTRLLAEVAHEFKAPLSIVIGYADLLQHDKGSLGEEHRSFASAIERSARQLTVLIDDLGDISNIESGHFTISKATYDVASSVKEIIDGMRISNEDYLHRLEFRGEDSESIIEGDSSRLGQVFTNLISNALKYSTEDEIVIVEIEVESDCSSMRVVVTDSGLGISEANLDELFTPYFRSSNADALERGGTGLGLFLSRSIVEGHGGTLTVSSTLGEGSTFVVDLPMGTINREFEAA